MPHSQRTVLVPAQVDDFLSDAIGLEVGANQGGPGMSQKTVQKKLNAATDRVAAGAANSESLAGARDAARNAALREKL